MLCVGLTTVDVSQRVAEFPVPGQKVQSLGVHLAPGGPAANAARAVAALGHRAVLLTALGGELGEFARSRLDPVEVHSVGTGGPALSMVAVRERDGERTVISRNAVEFDLAGSEVAGVGAADVVDPALVEAADVVLVDGHLGPLALAAARVARRTGVPVVLDAGSWKPVLDDLLPLVDVAACSAAFELSESEVHARGVPLVIRTHGPHPVTWSRGGVTGGQPVPVVEVRDTNGAGDVWHGALAVAVARGMAVDDAVRWANEVAAVRVRHTAWDWVEELERWRDSG
ncbi:PfkB family carbohydrate kinase [Saccharothrix deserti]|uniref:PfkB family carbohydrate kinase n=1 Tax=Saccharothrix deserti TaxID=2593674 RepID=UPI001390946C|nr:PfkB family carbohydrate kinase [Saccharothrix deserti]